MQRPRAEVPAPRTGSPPCFLEQRQQVARELSTRWVGLEEGNGIKGCRELSKREASVWEPGARHSEPAAASDTLERNQTSEGAQGD